MREGREDRESHHEVQQREHEVSGNMERLEREREREKGGEWVVETLCVIHLGDPETVNSCTACSVASEQQPCCDSLPCQFYGDQEGLGGAVGDVSHRRLTGLPGIHPERQSLKTKRNHCSGH